MEPRQLSADSLVNYRHTFLHYIFARVDQFLIKIVINLELVIQLSFNGWICLHCRQTDRIGSAYRKAVVIQLTNEYVNAVVWSVLDHLLKRTSHLHLPRKGYCFV